MYCGKGDNECRRVHSMLQTQPFERETEHKRPRNGCQPTHTQTHSGNNRLTRPPMNWTIFMKIIRNTRTTNSQTTPTALANTSAQTWPPHVCLSFGG